MRKKVSRIHVLIHARFAAVQTSNPYIMDNVFKFMGGFFSSLTQLLIGFAALAVVTEVVFGAEMFPGMTVVDNLTSLITTLGNGGFVGLVALLILWNILTKSKR